MATIRRPTALAFFVAVRGIGCAALVAAAAALAPARAGFVRAPDVVVLCEPTLKHALGQVAALWRQQTGIRVHIFPAPTRSLLEQLSHRIFGDVVIAEGEDMERQAIARKLIKPESRFTAWRNRLVAATRVDAPAPGDLASLIRERSPVAVVDPGLDAAGANSRAALAVLGLWDIVEGRSVGVVGTADAAYLLARGEARLALVYATDVAAEPAFAAAATLPDASYAPIIYWVAQTSEALSPQTGGFIAFLREPAAQRILHEGGLEVLQ
jgi:molybdate transport system substrate-binding protein